LKRGSETLDVADDRPLKRKCLTFIDDDDMDWLKGEITAIKECIREIMHVITDHLGRDVDVKLDSDDELQDSSY
jgi:hypothetical protein